MMRQTLLSYVLAGSFAALSFGVEFQVNTHTTYDQTDAAIAMDGGGSAVVVWGSYRQDGDSGGIFAQRLDPNCDPIGEEFQINAITAGNQKEPSVAMDASGNFVVVWQGPGTIEDVNEDIFARRFDPNGSPLGEEFRVNSNTSDKQLHPSVAISSDGMFVVVWESTNIPEEGTKAICGQLHDSSGEKFGSEFVVNEEPSDCRYSDVAMDANGNFAVVWMRERSSNSVMAKLYYADGSARTDTFEVSTISFGSVTQPSIAMDAAGYFVVAWDGDPSLASMDDIHARLYEPNGTPLGEQFVVNTSLTGAQQFPQLAMNNQGQLVVVWDSRIDPNVNERDIFGRRFNSFGEPIGDEFPINTYVEDDQRCPAITMGEDGRFVAVWQSDNQDGSRFGIFGDIGPGVVSADFNTDGLVNFHDYCILAEQWLDEQDALTADLTDDDVINQHDLAEFCHQWLTIIR